MPGERLLIWLGWALAATIVRVLVLPTGRTLGSLLMAFVVAVPVAILSGTAVLEWTQLLGVSYLAAFFAGLVALDVVLFALGVAGFLRINADTIARALMAKYTGMQHGKDTTRDAE